MVADAFSMLLELLSHDKMTAAALAEKLEVSERTIYRYIDVLSAAHVPIVCVKGRNGGIMIGEEFRLNSCYLTADEMQLLIAATESFSSPAEQKEDILLKLRSMRPTGSASGFADEDFAVDFSDTPLGDAFGAKLDVLIKAKKAHKAVDICYHNRAGDVSERTIEPYIFVYNNGNWYVFAKCRREMAMRMFKVSRITHMVRTDSDYVIPKDFERSWDLADPTRKRKIGVSLKVSEKARYDVEEWLGLENVHRADDDGFTAYGEIYDNDASFAKLLSFGPDVKVLHPTALAEKLHAEHEQAAKL